MAIQKLKVGEQIEVKLRDWKVGKTPNTGSLYVQLNFDNFISKTLWFSAKATEKSMELLEKFDYKFSDLSGLANPNALNRDRYWLVTIDEVKTGSKGTDFYSASWVNYAAGESMPDIDVDMDELKSIDTRAYIDGTNEPEKDHVPAMTGHEKTPDFTSDDIPF